MIREKGESEGGSIFSFLSSNGPKPIPKIQPVRHAMTIDCVTSVSIPQLALFPARETYFAFSGALKRNYEEFEKAHLTLSNFIRK